MAKKNTAWFIAQRMAFSHQQSFSRLIIRIAVVAIMLSVTVMHLSTALVQGFQQEISTKLFGFWGHIQVTKFDRNSSFENTPILSDQLFIPILDTMAGIRNVQAYATKPGILKEGDNIDGIILKGVGFDYHWAFLERQLVAGRLLELPADTMAFEILISQITANRLRLSVADRLTVNFIDPETLRIRSRRFTIVGIYNTGIAESDKLFALVDIRQIQRLNNWGPNQVGGYEVFIDDLDQLQAMERRVYYELPASLNSRTIEQLQPTIFDWLELQSTNEVVILVLMIIVAIINMITALLILILERTNMIGILKALGGGNGLIQRVFLINAAYIILAGLVLGNVVGLGLAGLQHQFGFIQLPEETYYVSTAPVAFNWLSIGLINIGTLLVCLAVLILPSFLISRIQPIKAIRFN